MFGWFAFARINLGNQRERVANFGDGEEVYLFLRKIPYVNRF